MKLNGVFSHGLVVREIVVRFLSRRGKRFIASPSVKAGYDAWVSLYVRVGEYVWVWVSVCVGVGERVCVWVSVCVRVGECMCGCG